MIQVWYCSRTHEIITYDVKNNILVNSKLNAGINKLTFKILVIIFKLQFLGVL